MNKYAKLNKAVEKEKEIEVLVVNENLLQDDKIKEIMATTTILEDLDKKTAPKEKGIEEVTGNMVGENNTGDDEKKKTNRGRPSKYKKDEMKKIAALIDTELRQEFKTMLTNRGFKIRPILVRYIENWMENPRRFDYPYDLTKKRISNGVLVEKATKERFSELATETEMPQTYILESLYKDIMKDLVSGNMSLIEK